MSETITQTKICNKCKVEKLISEFYKDNRLDIGSVVYRARCKECVKSYQKQNAEHIKQRKQKKYQENKQDVISKSQEYYANNKECSKKRMKKYRETNKIYFYKYNKQYRESNRNAIAEQHKQYYKTNKGKAVSKNSEYKRRNIKKQGDVTTKQLLELQQNSKNCYWCKTSLNNKKVHIDHYSPLSKGGEHTISNLVVSCSKCNLSKYSKDPLEFAQSIGRLL